MAMPITTKSIAGEPIRARRGAEISCQGWQQEAALRMLMNSLDPEVAENPEKLLGRAGSPAIAANWNRLNAIAASLQALGNEQTLLVRSGQVSSVECTQRNAPRALIVNSFGGVAKSPRAGTDSWTYLGAQEALHAAYEMFALAARKHFQSNLAGKLVVGAGMGRDTGARSLAATMNGAAFLGIDVNPESIKRRVKSGYCDVMVNNLDEALRILKNAVRTREATSVGLAANSADVIPEMARRGLVPDLLAGSLSAENMADGYVPQGMDASQSAALLESNAATYRQCALESFARQTEGMLALQKLGSLRVCLAAGAGIGPVRLLALSGETGDLHRLGHLILEKFPDDEILCRWFILAHKHTRFQGLPSRICTLPRGGHARFGVAVNDLVARGELKAPIVIGADFESDDVFTATSPIETLVAEMTAAANGASWLSVRPRSAAGNGDVKTPSPRVGRVVVADGTAEMAARIEQVFNAPPGNHVAPERHSS